MPAPWRSTACCTTAADCDDQNPCTDDACGADGQCTRTVRQCFAGTTCATSADPVPAVCDGAPAKTLAKLRKLAAQADGTVVEANPGESGTGEIVVPEEGLGYICSVPGHADAGMTGAITVAGVDKGETLAGATKCKRKKVAKQLKTAGKKMAAAQKLLAKARKAKKNPVSDDCARALDAALGQRRTAIASLATQLQGCAPGCRSGRRCGCARRACRTRSPSPRT